MTAAPGLCRALAAALRAAPPQPRQAAVTALAKRLAVELDATTDPDVVAKLAPRYLAALVELGMGKVATGTPAPPVSRETEGGAGERPGVVTLAELQRRARARADGSANLDAPAG